MVVIQSGLKCRDMWQEETHPGLPERGRRKRADSGLYSLEQGGLLEAEIPELRRLTQEEPQFKSRVAWVI